MRFDLLELLLDLEHERGVLAAARPTIGGRIAGSVDQRREQAEVVFEGAPRLGEDPLELPLLDGLGGGVDVVDRVAERGGEAGDLRGRRGRGDAA